MAIDLSRKIVSIQEACELAGVTRRTIYNWMAHNRLECIRTAGGSLRIYADSLFRAAEKKKETQ